MENGSELNKNHQEGNHNHCVAAGWTQDQTAADQSDQSVVCARRRCDITRGGGVPPRRVAVPGGGDADRRGRRHRRHLQGAEGKVKGQSPVPPASCPRLIQPESVCGAASAAVRQCLETAPAGPSHSSDGKAN